MTSTQRNAIVTPATGLQVYNTTTNTNDTYNGTAWISNSVNGVPGAIQFSTGSAFSSDASNLFWDDTNKRLGVDTNTPTKELTIDANSTDGGLIIRSHTDQLLFQVTKDGNSVATSELFQYVNGAINFALRSATNASYFNVGTFTFGATTDLGAKVSIKGSGSTSATTSLLVQDSAGNALLQCYDDGSVNIGRTNAIVTFNQGYNNTFNQNRLSLYSATTNIRGINAGGQGLIVSKNTGITDLYPSSIFSIDSTTQGFLPPRMLQTQRTAITSPAIGLIVYQTDMVEGLYIYKSTGWTFII
jgi:hypothetical protein